MTGDPRRREADGREREAGENGSGNPESQAQRERLINAFTKVASERGYGSTEVGFITGCTSEQLKRIVQEVDNSRADQWLNFACGHPPTIGAASVT